MKTCTNCNKAFPIETYRPHKQGRKGKRAKCRTCEKVFAKLYRDSHKEEIKAYNKRVAARKRVLSRNWKLRKHYGLTPEDFDILLMKQKGACAICLKTQEQTGKILNVDHCHKTGKVRGLLCGGCNASLGVFEDSIETLQRAIAYLEVNKR